MSSPAETVILMSVLGAVLASLPVAMVLWRRSPAVPGDPPPLPPPLPVPPPLPERHDPFQTPQAYPLAPAVLPAVLPAVPAAWSRKDAWFALVLVLVVSVLLGPVSSFLVMLSGAPESEMKIEYTASLFVTQIIFQGGVIALVLVWLRGVRRFNLGQLFGLKERGPLLTAGLALLWLVAAYVVLIAVSLTVLPILQKILGIELKQQGLVESAPNITDIFTRTLMVITLCIGAPLMEELIFRGVIFSVAARYFHPAYAIIASSVLFSVIHNNLLGLIPLAVLGAFLAEAYRRTRTLAVPVLMHAAFNAVTFIAVGHGSPEFLQS